MRILRPARWSLLLYLLPALLVAAAAYGGEANPPAAERTRTEISAMLTTFLTPAVNNTAAGHERFWAGSHGCDSIPVYALVIRKPCA